MCRVSSELYFYMHINTLAVVYHTSFAIGYYSLLLDNSEVISNTSSGIYQLNILIS